MVSLCGQEAVKDTMEMAEDGVAEEMDEVIIVDIEDNSITT